MREILVLSNAECQFADNKQYTNCIRDLIVITFFFILDISLIHVIAQQIQKIRACIVA